MKRSRLLLLCSLVLAGTFWSCDVFEKEVMSVLIYGEHYYTGRRAPDWEVVSVPGVYLYGRLSGSRFPEFDHLQIGDLILRGSEYYENQHGYVHFSSYHRVWQDSIAEPKFDPLSVTIASDLGSLTGSITVPDTLLSLTVDAPDTIPLNTPLTISWSGGNADYYMLVYFHDWMEGDFGWLGNTRDTMVTDSAVTFDSTYFTKNGSISYIEVYPVNGPVPRPGSAPNMTGDGAGFLYMENREIRSDRVIVIGEGITFYTFLKRTNRPGPEKSTAEARYRRVTALLGL